MIYVIHHKSKKVNKNIKKNKKYNIKNKKALKLILETNKGIIIVI